MTTKWDFMWLDPTDQDIIDYNFNCGRLEALAAINSRCLSNRALINWVEAFVKSIDKKRELKEKIALKYNIEYDNIISINNGLIFFRIPTVHDATDEIVKNTKEDFDGKKIGMDSVEREAVYDL